MTDGYHVPVMADEVIESLDPRPGGIYVDATLGGGGHSERIAERIGANGILVGIDQDAEAIATASWGLSELVDGPKLVLVQARFDQLAQILAEHKIAAIDGILFDLGVSSHQLDESARGFSFKDPTMPLDMRMNPEAGVATAADILNSEDENNLTRIFRDFSDERWAARIAQFVVERRGRRPFAVAGDLVDTIKAAVPSAAREKSGIHPATRVFQALRIAVNEEFDVLETALEQSVRALRCGGEAAISVISYHSGEDRIVKRLFQRLAGKCECPPELLICRCGASDPVLEILTRKPILPTAAEIARNPRARSAKMRTALKR